MIYHSKWHTLEPHKRAALNHTYHLIALIIISCSSSSIIIETHILYAMDARGAVQHASKTTTTTTGAANAYNVQRDTFNARQRVD